MSKIILSFDTRLTPPGDISEFLTKHLILVAGGIIGTWQRKMKKAAVSVHIKLPTTMTAAEPHTFCRRAALQ